MPMTTSARHLDEQELLEALVARLRKALGGRLQAVRLYGSRARGGAGPDSDVDILVEVDHLDEETRERTRQARYEIMWEAGFEPFVSLRLVEPDNSMKVDSSFLRTALREGRLLYRQPK